MFILYIFPYNKSTIKTNKFSKKVLTKLKVKCKIIQTNVQQNERVRIMRKVKENVSKVVKIFGLNFELNVMYKYIKKPNLDIKGRNIEISLPNKYKKINNDIIIELLLQKMYDAIARKELDNIMEKVRVTLKFAPEEYEIMRIDKTLGKCLADKIIINPDIVKYKKDTIEYIIFHEFCHLKVKKHSKKFYEILEKYMPNYENYAYELIGMQY